VEAIASEASGGPRDTECRFGNAARLTRFNSQARDCHDFPRYSERAALQQPEPVSMDDLIVAALLGEATQEELRLLREWRRFNAANNETYRRYLRLWSLLGEIEPGTPRHALPPPQP
jgi:hypothetical protein